MRHQQRVAHVVALVVMGVCFLASPALAQDCPELVGRWPYGPISAVAVSGDYAYFGSGAALMVADVSNPSTPQVVGNVALPGLVGAIAVSGGYAYVVGESLSVIDVSTPSSPTQVGFLEIQSYALSVAVSGGYAYIAAMYEGLRVIDVQVPSAPVEVGCYETVREASNVAVSGGYAYVTDDGEGLRVVDVSTPSAPRQVGFLEIQSYTSSVAVSGAYAYLADGGAGLRVIDVSTPSAPRQVGSVDTPGNAVDVAVLGGYAYVADDYEGLRVIDVSTPSAPRQVGHIYSTPVQAWGVAVQGGHAYVADVWAGLRVVNVNSPSAPREVAFLDTPDGAVGIAVSGDYAYVAEYGLRVLDVGTPSAPVEVGFVDMSWAANVAVMGGYAYVAAMDEGLRVIDVHDPSHPVEVGSVDTPNLANDVAVLGHYAYVADFSSGLQVIDVSVPHDPRRVGSVDTPGQALAVAVSGSYAYVADRLEGLRVIDVSNPYHPREVGFLQTDDSWDVAVQGSYAYVADNFSGLRIIDVSTPSTPVEVGSVTYHVAKILSVAVSGGYAYVADQWSARSLRVIDVETPTAPVEVGRYETVGGASDVAVSGGSVFLADGSAGLAVFNECVFLGDPRQSFIPAAAVATGAQGAFFQTDVEVNNTGAHEAQITFQWLPRGQDNSEPMESDPIALAPGQSRRYENVLTELFGLGPDSFGALKLVASSPWVIGMSRTYNVPAAKAAGTFGQGLPAIRATKMIVGTEPQRIIFLSEDPDSRANVGCVNGTGEQLRIHIKAFDAQGSPLDTWTMNLAPYSDNQINRILQDYQPVNGYVDVWADSDDALYYCYGSMLDNLTSDPTTILPQAPSAATTFIPAASYAAGAQGAFFQTDVDLNNVGSTDISYQLLWLPRGVDNSDPVRSQAFSLAPGAGVRYTNVLSTVFGLDQGQVGGLAIEASGTDLLAMSRTYRVPSAKVAGTFGQEMPGIPANQMIPPLVRKRIMFMNEDDDIRSNVGCQNGGLQAVWVSLELYSSNGELLGYDGMTLPPLSNKQINRVFRNYAPVSAGYVDVSTISDSPPVYCYGSVLDNLTSDPTTVLPQQQYEQFVP